MVVIQKCAVKAAMRMQPHSGIVSIDKERLYRNVNRPLAFTDLMRTLHGRHFEPTGTMSLRAGASRPPAIADDSGQ